MARHGDRRGRVQYETVQNSAGASQRVLRLPPSIHLTFDFGTRSPTPRPSRHLLCSQIGGGPNFDHAAPHRSSVPLGSGRFSAEQRGRAVKQQCQSTAQGRFASVRSANNESSAATPSAARRRRSTGCTLHVSLKKNESIRPSRRPPPRPTHPHSKTRRRRDQRTRRPPRWNASRRRRPSSPTSAPRRA